MRPERGTDPSSPFNAVVKNDLSFKSAPPLHFHFVHRDFSLLGTVEPLMEGLSVAW